MLILVSLILCLGVTFIGVQMINPVAAGLDRDTLTLWPALICGVAIYAGIVSSVVFDRFDKRLKAPKFFFAKTDLLIAAILSPLVFLAFYPLLQQGQDVIIQTLVAYQNGFLFQNVTSRLRKHANET